MTIRGLMIDPITSMPIVVLREPGGARMLPIWVGVFEANAIALQIENVQTPRPMTHDLLRSVIENLRGAVVRVVVCDLRENTFYASIHLDTPAGPVLVDARPSDAIALALRAGAPIFVEDHVIEAPEAPTEEAAPRSADVERLQKWLEGLSEEDLGKYKM